MGLDIGDSRIGVALSDPLGILATPLTIIDRENDGSAIEKITAIIREKGVERVIIGLPLNMDSSHGPQAEKTVSFAEELRRCIELPVLRKPWVLQLRFSISMKARVLPVAISRILQ